MCLYFLHGRKMTSNTNLFFLLNFVDLKDRFSQDVCEQMSSKKCLYNIWRK